MTIYDRIKKKLHNNLPISCIDLVDDSAKHAGHSGAKPGGETHFNLKIVSENFIGKNKVARHKMVYSILKDEMEGPVHALSIIALTPEEEKVASSH
jgi:BolA protein